MAKSFKCVVGGLLFYPPKGVSYYHGISEWVNAGCPDNSLVYDMYDFLEDCGFPIVDSVIRLHGVYVRLPKRLPMKEATITLNNYCDNRKRKVLNEVDGIYFANPNIKKHKMVK